MIRLMYFSTSTTDMSQSEVDALVQKSAENNHKHGISGVLAYNGRNFCQVLEGEADQVNKLVAVIREDNRHAGFKILGEMPIESRRFAEWAMTRVDELDFSDVMDAMQP